MILSFITTITSPELLSLIFKTVLYIFFYLFKSDQECMQVEVGASAEEEEQADSELSAHSHCGAQIS